MSVLNSIEAAMVLGVLRSRFPELGFDREMNGGDVVQELGILYEDMRKTVRSKEATDKAQKEITQRQKFREFAELVSRLTRDQECATCASSEDENPNCDNHELFDMPSDDAVETLCNLIRQARELPKAEPEPVNLGAVSVICELQDGVLDDPEIYATDEAAAEAIIEKLTGLDGFTKEPKPQENRMKYAMALYTDYHEQTEDGDADYEIRWYANIPVE